MGIDYLKVYTELRTGKLTFEQFMGVLGEAADIGRRTAELSHPACPLDEFDPIPASHAEASRRSA